MLKYSYTPPSLGSVVNSRKVFLDKDYIRAKNIVACVVGYLHPPNKVICYPKYLVTHSGESLWKRDGELYMRIVPDYSTLSIVKSISFLKKIYSKYVYYDNFFKTEVVGIPLNDILLHYLPEKRLSEMLSEKQLDMLEEKAVNLVKMISKESKVNLKDFGITGSILLKIHNINISDINLVVYGVDSSWKVYEALTKIDFIRPYKKWIQRMSKVYNMPLKLAEKICSRRINRGVYSGRNFSLSFVLKPHEVKKKYGEYSYKILGKVDLKAIVICNKYSLFYPYTYVIQCFDIKGSRSLDIRELLCFQGIYCGVFYEGEKVRIKGVLLEVTDGEEKYYSVAVGLREYTGFIEPIS